MSTALGQILEEIFQDTGVPAIAAIVVDHNTVIDQAALGVRLLDHGELITIHDKFHAGSNTKAMTATLCAILVHKKLLSWQTTPLVVFPDLENKILPEYEAVTLEMLLTHRAGIPPYTDDESDDFVIPVFAKIPREQQITFFSKWLLQNRVPINQPGSEFSYSNAGYSIAGAMVEAVTGKTWKENLEEYLLEPLKIDAEVANGWPALHDPNQPWGHLVRNGEIVPHPPNHEYQLEMFLAPAGDVCLSLPDFGKFLQMHLQGLRGKTTIIPSDLIQRMHNYGNLGNGMGWGVVTLRSMEVFGLFSTHAGSAGTFILVAGVSHSSDRAVALATNAGNPEIMQGIKKIIQVFVGFD